MNDLQLVQFYDKYSRWLDSDGRFETFQEAVDRSIEHARYVAGSALTDFEYSELRNGMLNFEAFPSMRWFQMAGPEARKHPQSIFNCSYVQIDCIDSFVEALFLLGLGVGVGFSVEIKNVSKLPLISKTFDRGDYLIVVEDSLEGWADSMRVTLEKLYEGWTIKLDVSKIRPAGSRLKTRGGIASGPQPFVEAVAAIQDIFISAAGRQLKPIEAHDVMCFIASAIVSGGVRRSAMISLFDKNDKEMLTCKSDSVIGKNKQRYYANNSLVIDSILDKRGIDEITEIILKNDNGEPGIFNRWAANNTSPSRRKYANFGTNPCGEVFLRDMQFCNLSIANVRSEDTLSSLLKKVRLATIWGTIQACVDSYVGLRDEWSRNQKDERLLGVDLNGLFDNEHFWPESDTGPLILNALKNHAKNINKLYSSRLGINMAAAVTCNKPAGNSSVFFNTASGIHPRFSKYYIRRVTLSTSSSLAQFLIMNGVNCEPTNGLDWVSATTAVFDFYVDASTSLTSDDVSLSSMLEHWLTVKKNWTEHNPSCTIYYPIGDLRELSKEKIKNFLYKNQDIISGITFLPIFQDIWKQAPYEKITKEQYGVLTKDYKAINWEAYKIFDQVYRESIGQEYACVGGSCEL